MYCCHVPWPSAVVLRAAPSKKWGKAGSAFLSVHKASCSTVKVCCVRAKTESAVILYVQRLHNSIEMHRSAGFNAQPGRREDNPVAHPKARRALPQLSDLAIALSPNKTIPQCTLCKDQTSHSIVQAVSKVVPVAVWRKI